MGVTLFNKQEIYRYVNVKIYFAWRTIYQFFACPYFRLYGMIIIYLYVLTYWSINLARIISMNIIIFLFFYSINLTTASDFAYSSYGVNCAQVELDVLTGEIEILRSDILFDCGQRYVSNSVELATHLYKLPYTLITQGGKLLRFITKA